MQKIKLKVVVFQIVMLMLNASVSAQSSEKIVGKYIETSDSGDGRSVNYYLLKNNRFVIVAYATLITGKWYLNDSKIVTLMPTNPELPFSLYGFHNPSIKTGTKIMFFGFIEGENFIKLDGADTVQRVFNVNPNCATYPYVHQFSEKGSEISFASFSAVTKNNSAKVYSFKNESGYNDFIAYYVSPSKFHKPFTFKITEKGLLNTQNKKVSEKSKELNKEDIEMLKEVNESIDKGNSGIVKFEYFSPSYRYFANKEISSNNYVYNRSKNAFITKKRENVKGGYHDSNVVYKYSIIEDVVIENKKLKINKEKPLFRAECAADKAEAVD